MSERRPSFARNVPRASLIGGVEKAKDEIIIITPELVLDQAAELGEGPIWDCRRKELLWLDILGSKIFSYNPETGTNTQLDLSSKTNHVTTIVPIEYNGADVVIGTTTGIAKVDLSVGIDSYEEHDCNDELPGHGEFVRMNDGKCDPQGRLWIGSISRVGPGGADLAPGGAKLYCYYDWEEEPTKVLDGITVSNGLCWSVDGRTMYYTDSPSFHVDVMDFDGEAEDVELIATNRRKQFQVSDSFPPVPDGNAMDTDGMLWVACFGAGEVRRYDPKTGEITAVVRLPTEAGKESTAVAFGGEELDELYITTAHEFWDKEKMTQFPKAGGLYKVSREELRKKFGKVLHGVPPNHFKPCKGRGMCGSATIVPSKFPEGTFVEVTTENHADFGKCGVVLRESYAHQATRWKVQFEEHATWVDAVKLADGVPDTKLISQAQVVLAMERGDDLPESKPATPGPRPSRMLKDIPKVKTREWKKIPEEGDEAGATIDEEALVGCKVEVAGGTSAGRQGKILKVNNGRYRVMFEDGMTTWTTKVKPL